ncbi:hypothetical protein W97_03680 [Coniosporium apollinis CBS 100218]|uniref:Mediator of RNA polymerase II transcription subunit 20 n=1 Tax=Coniosporium apollinis (strain CBS 100218) TaxID=1168221 RepID=R7YRK9_CONA1|nr:uncharacterized protein W97_03680 [Coniosporium apollinis CBS 100218]EON64449.1 hypothetical protein W97_03680 [Coniosporium apollinis CBS 100218]
MGALRLFFISENQSSNTVEVLNERLLRTCDPEPLGSWTLDHRLLRSTPSSIDFQGPWRYQHLLRLGHDPSKTFVHVADPSNTEDPARNATIAIPFDQQSAFANLLTSKYAALWTPKQTVQVQNGHAYAVGEFIIRLGELRLVGVQQRHLGVIVSIQETVAPDNDEPKENGELAGPRADPDPDQLNGEGLRQVQDDIEDLWKQFGISSAKELSNERPDGSRGGLFEDIRLWCELLRLRG